jgi:hypothetical protein
MEKYICRFVKKNWTMIWWFFEAHRPPHYRHHLAGASSVGAWAGICKECLEYYRKSIGHNAFLEDIEDTAS